jgi:4-hydroxy-tetrahydrodipicolinate synthase
MTAIVTPFKSGMIDEAAFRKLINMQISGGIDAVVVCGSTGEGMTLSDAERERLVRIAVEEAAGRVPIIAGAGSNSTDRAIDLSRRVKSSGADCLLHVTPYYNKPPQEGLVQHFMAIAEVVDMPIILYNVPSRTGINMLPETTARLSACERIVGIKESCGNLEQIKKVRESCDEAFSVLCGDDALNFNCYRFGCNGCVSVTGNVMPEKIAKVYDLFCAGDKASAEKLQEELSEINAAMFLESNPIPVKTSLALMGLCREEFRLPLTPMGEAPKEKLTQVLRRYDLI